MIDYHVHTSTSYCGEKKLTPESYFTLLEKNNEVDTFCITDHAFAIFFPEDIAWSWEYMNDSSVFDQYREWGIERLENHFDNIRKLENPRIIPGIELEMMHDERLTIPPEQINKAEIIIGSVHFLPENNNFSNTDEGQIEYWRRHVLKLINSGIDILGHPFRWFCNAAGFDPDEKLIHEIVSECKKNDVAVEINNHHKVPVTEKVLKKALELNAALSIASDNHSVQSKLNYAFHKNLLDKFGMSTESIPKTHKMKSLENKLTLLCSKST